MQWRIQSWSCWNNCFAAATTVTFVQVILKNEIALKSSKILLDDAMIKHLSIPLCPAQIYRVRKLFWPAHLSPFLCNTQERSIQSSSSELIQSAKQATNHKSIINFHVLCKKKLVVWYRWETKVKVRKNQNTCISYQLDIDNTD